MRPLALLAAVALVAAVRATDVPLPDLKKVTPIVLDGHGKEVGAAGFSRDGKLAATGCYDRAVRVFDADTGKEQGTFKEHDWVITALAVAPDVQAVASTCCNSQKRSIRIWDPATLKEAKNIPLKDNVVSVHDLAYLPDGKHLAGVSDGLLNIWDVATGERTVCTRADAGVFRRLAYSPYGKRIALAGGQGGGAGKGILRVYDVAADKMCVAFVDADAGKELIAVAWPTADAILAIGVRGSDAKALRVELGK